MWFAIAPECSTCQLDRVCDERVQIAKALIDIRRYHPEHHGQIVIKSCKQRVPIGDDATPDGVAASTLNRR